MADSIVTNKGSIRTLVVRAGPLTMAEILFRAQQELLVFIKASPHIEKEKKLSECGQQNLKHSFKEVHAAKARFDIKYEKMDGHYPSSRYISRSLLIIPSEA